MKAAIFLASLAASASAQVVITTEQECFKGEGGRFIDNCNDVYFLTCDNYEVDAAASCNVFVFSDSRVTWITSDIKSSYWEYYQSGDEGTDAVFDGTADFGTTKEEGKRCFAAKETPSVYK